MIDKIKYVSMRLVKFFPCNDLADQKYLSFVTKRKMLFQNIHYKMRGPFLTFILRA